MLGDFNDKKMLSSLYKKVQYEWLANAQKHSRLSAMIFIMKIDEVPEFFCSEHECHHSDRH